jgi:hypothetical protein
MPINFVVGFGEGEDGTLYAVSQGTGIAYKVVATDGGPLPVTLVEFAGTIKDGYNNLSWKTAAEQNTSRFYIEYSKDGTSFARVGTIAASRSAGGSSYSFRHNIGDQGTNFYRLAIEEDNGATSFSSIIKLSGGQAKSIRIYPTIVNNGLLKLENNGKQVNSIILTNTNGMIVFKKDLTNTAGVVTINLPVLAKGSYVVQIMGDGFSQTERIMIQ